MVARTGWRITLRFRTMTGSLKSSWNGGSAGHRVSWSGRSATSPRSTVWTRQGPFVAGALSGLAAAALAGAAVAPPPPPMDVAPPPSDPYPYYAPAPPRRVYWRQHR